MGKGLAWGARQAGPVVLSLQAAGAGGTLGSASSCCVLSIWRSAASWFALVQLHSWWFCCNATRHEARCGVSLGLV